MTLIEKWRSQGVDVSFAELAEHTLLDNWLEVLLAKTANHRQKPESTLAEQEKWIPLTHAQAGLWQELDEENSALFNTGECVEINGAVDRSLFETALRKVVSETDALHVSFDVIDDEPVQKLVRNDDWELNWVRFFSYDGALFTTNPP